MNNPGTPKPVCQLVGTDGNVFSIIGRVKRTLVEVGEVEQAAEFVEKTSHAGSYDEVLLLCMEYVDVH